jgi:hypothetical protein
MSGGSSHSSIGTASNGGLRFHFINLAIVALLLLLFGSVSPSSTDEGAPTTGHYGPHFPLWCIYFGQLGLLYDNLVNAMGPYLGKGMTLRRLSKYKFVWHVTAMPLFAIPVTTIGYRGGGQDSIMDESTYLWTIRFLVAVSLLDGLSWIVHCRPQDLRLVDNRQSNHSKGMHLAGTLTYTANAFWQVILPPVLLVLYEIVVAIRVLTVTSVGSASAYSTMTIDQPSTNDDTVKAAKLLLVCGVVTLLSSGMGSTYPHFQLLGESLHSLLLWAAYCTSIGR